MSAAKAVLYLCLAALAACASRPPDVTEYLLDVPRVEPMRDGSAPLGPVRVRTLMVRPFLDRDGIAYRVGPVEAGAYRYHRWAENPGVMVSWLLADGLRRGGQFAGVLRSDQVGDSDFELEGELLGLHESAEEAGAPVQAVVEVALRVRLTSDPSQVLAAGSFREEVLVRGDSVEALVLGLREAAREVCEQAVRRLEAELAPRAGENPGT